MRRKKQNLVKVISLCLLLLFLVTGCRKAAVYHDLSEEDANEIIVALYDVGINAEKEELKVQNEVSWNVLVGKKNLAEARKILIDRGLPRKRELGLGGVYKEKGLIPTPDEQKARFLLAIKGEIVNSLEKIPEVVDADVVINIPTPDEFADNDDKRTTASVVLKVRPEENIASQLTESKVQQYVANSIEDLNPRDVSVIISYVTAPKTDIDKKLFLPKRDVEKDTPKIDAHDGVSLLGIKVTKDSAKRLKVYLLIFFIIIILLAAVLIVFVVRTTRMKQEYKALIDGGARPLLEGEIEEPRPQLGTPEEEEGEEPS